MQGLIKLENFFVRTSVYKSLGFLFSIVFCVVLFPVTSHAQVLLSEIAWMGTDEDANNEWIEIYNFNTASTDLTGWTLTSDDGAIAIHLSGTLSAHAVGVLERTDDTTLPQVTAFQTYTGALTNGGTTLTLKDGSGVISDQAIGGTDWASVGGSNVAPKKTPQRTRSGSWVTALPTPGTENAETNDLVTTSDANTTTETNTATKKSSSGGGNSSTKLSTSGKVTEFANPVLSLAFDMPNTVYVNEKLTLEAESSGLGKTIMNSLKYTWNFGDTYTETGRIVSHTFSRPGEYTVVLHGAYAKHDAMVRHDVTVLPTIFEISRSPQGDLIVHNKSPQEIDLGGFALGLKKEFVFPEYTFIKAGGSLTVPKERIQKVLGLISLLDTQGVVVAYERGAIPQQVLNTGMVLRKPAPQALVGDVSRAPEETQKKMNVEKPMQQLARSEELPSETVIQIGKEHISPEEEGFVLRMFQKLTSLFGF